ncbi:molecular chaperone HtpG [Duncaniella muris]|jgi:molecular chaperone HtpG|uniref:molecular chaperone HtpG n=1 Tax=Duncaniella muris TaxID=2094150 RepID=UPI000F48C08F|nr:molecular chaperone HtpG [Duncaniella muris]ROS97348.1 molecular chaperone HtpG [Muribaculaceae bacterium Isolate-077 (Janvier)]ROS97624.1 molecular chaperone HtpG [Muribaculaceae bacterium Isolate-083 (Janvier)]ROT01070.1 molecular chaperone HtpG [Muribaculaceae bacterium Isolate-084 (Janvier)]
MQKGQIGVTTENIFPVIKKFLYSDHEIFLRELVSNAIDATQKLKTLASFGEFKGELGEMDVRVKVDKEAGTLTVSDRGIGMTAEDIDKYINQIAFSGAEEFVNKYKDTANAIIGHFGLGFYSAFMVAKKVEIRSLSYKEGAEAVCWECDGSPEYSMGPADKTERGTDIVLYIDDDNKEFLEQARIDTLLKKYCRFLPVPVISGKVQEWKDGKYVDTDKDKVVNDTEPTWTKKPSELTDEDYRKFYRELYPGQEDPLFWIHLNVDYPFTLTGILFFPKIKSNLDIRKDRIQLYCNQVFVTDSVEGVVPEFMTLLQGVIDSPDIPLNVSRSYLQSDTAVKKISGYITKKVASRLEELFKENRADFESKWDDIKIFIEYGMLTDEKFCDAAMKFVLLRDTEGKYFTLEEYRTLVESAQTDKDGNVVYIYATDPTGQFSFINAANEKGYNVLLMDGQLDGHFISMLESKLEKTRFVRVDSEVAEKLIPKEDSKDSGLNADQISLLTPLFRSQIPAVDKAEFLVSFESLDPAASPILITQNEYMRRMKDMAATQAGMSFYAELPDSYNLIVNTSQPVVARILDEAEKALADKLTPLSASIDSDNEKITTLRAEIKDNKPTDEQKAEEQRLTDSVEKARKEKDEIIGRYAAEKPVVKQAIDLALLSNGLLRGRDLSEFIKRSTAML